MVTATPYISRVLKKFTKTITFDGGTGTGAVGTVTVGTVTGSILLDFLTCRCNTDLAGATATVELGVTGNTAALIAQTTATDIDDGDWWHDATPEVGVGSAVSNATVEGNILITVGTAAVSAGVLEFVMYWHPLSSDANLA